MSGHPSEASEIDFDDGNESELAAHGITALEIFQVIQNGALWVPNKKGRAGVWLGLGRTDGGRLLTFPAAYDEAKTSVRPITGWDTTPGERSKYMKGIDHE